MIEEISITELVSLLAAVFFAAVASASVRGLSDSSETPLASFRKFYLDLSTALVGLALLSVGGLGTWTMLGTWYLSSTRMNLFLPMAIGLLLLGLALARHKWTGRKRRRSMDLIATGVFIALIVVAALIGTSHATAAERLDAAANGVFGTYCSGHRDEVAATERIVAALWPTAKPMEESRDEVDIARLAVSDNPPALVADIGKGVFHTPRSGRMRRNKKDVRRDLTPSEFCDALETYLALRSVSRSSDEP